MIYRDKKKRPKKRRNSAVRREKVMSEKNQGLRYRGGGWKQALFCQVIIKAMLLPIMLEVIFGFKAPSFKYTLHVSGLNNCYFFVSKCTLIKDINLSLYFFIKYITEAPLRNDWKYVLVITCLRGKFGINLPGSLF